MFMMRMPEQWIWLPEEAYPLRQTTNYSGFDDVGTGNYTVAEFQKHYAFGKMIASVTLRFSGDSAFLLYCNGDVVATGPVCVGGDFLGNDKPRPNFYCSEVTLSPGTDHLDVFARVRMVPTRLSEYSKGHGGFMLSAAVTFCDGTKTVVHTDNSWSVRLNEAYTANDRFDGRKKGGAFLPAEEIDNLWHTSVAPIPVCVEEPLYPENHIITLLPKEKKTVTLPFDKIYCGFLTVSVRAGGVCFMTAHCREKGADGITEELIFDGDGTYRGFTLHSANEIDVTAENTAGTPCTIDVSFAYTHYPVSEIAVTETSDAALNQVLETCRHTLKICRQTHHLDSTLHCEPLACTGDYYIETLMTLFSYGDMRLSEFDALRTAELLRNNGGVMFHTTYSLIWPVMLYDIYKITGHTKLLDQCEDALILLLDRFRTYLGENGLIENPPNYMFVDWIYIDGLSMHHPPKALGQTCLNMFYFGALDAAEKIFTVLGETAMADDCAAKKEALKLAVNRLLFDETKGVYFEGLNTKTDENAVHQYLPQNVEKRYYLKHANILAAYFGICDDTTAKTLIGKVMRDEIEGNYQPYFAHYLLEAIYRYGLRETYTLAEIDKWKPHVSAYPGGLTEGFYKPEPGYEFDHSHAWGGTPLYSLPKALLGLEILTPGMRKIAVSPSLLGLKSATVELATACGKVVFRLAQGKPPVISAPDGITVEVRN